MGFLNVLISHGDTVSVKLPEATDSPYLHLLFTLPAKYFAITMVIVGLSVIATVVVLQYHHHDPDGSKMPKWVSASFMLR